MSGIDNEFDKFDRHPKWYLGSRFLAVVGILVALSLVGAVGSYALGWFAAPYQGKLAARQQINSGNYRIAAYDHFFNLCASIQTADNNIATQESLLGQFQKGGDDYNRTLTNIAGLESVRADGINQYNADASKSYTVGQFRASNLPYQLPTHSYQKGEQITCAR
jgi:hypothetical protein